ncbi:P-loop containing nucleoside triphosphate hydrolase protein [Calocera cornea HHB12733]|uniref:DNA 3'-5' helicase n=1 Tax=Calocera cornea HHB12733 TaxID=1353952 RepID=A0A165C1X4_9BASI|nr:P-loop containing nucleoside triphosphate hydrolase protein [Calocera cornea HHB12733]
MCQIAPGLGLRNCRQILVALHRQALMSTWGDDVPGEWWAEAGMEEDYERQVGTEDEVAEVAFGRRPCAMNYIGDLQAGHTSAVSYAHYAVTSREPWRLSPGLAQKYIRYSFDWHWVLGLRNERTALAVQAHKGTDSGCYRRVNGTGPAGGDAFAAIERLDTGGASWGGMLSQMRGVLREEISRRDANLLATLGRPAVHPSSELSGGGRGLRAGGSGVRVRDGLLTALRDFLHSRHARWTCREQAEAVEHAVRRKEHVLAVLPCGAGKSLIYMLPTFRYLPPDRFTVCILPFISLVQDVQRRCAAYGVPCALYRTGSDAIRNPLRQREYGGPTQSPYLVLMSVESLRSGSTIQDLVCAGREGRLAYVVIDETHLALTAVGFREAFGQLNRATLSGVTQIHLSGSLSPRSEPALLEAMCITEAVVLRAPTIRLDIGYHVLRIEDPDELLGAFFRHIRGRMAALKGTQRGLVFCRTITEAEEVASVLRCPVYHSDRPRGERTEVLRKFTEGGDAVLVGTSALTTGIDVAHIRWVYFLRGAWSLQEVVQGSARAARKDGGAEGEGADCWVFSGPVNDASARREPFVPLAANSGGAGTSSLSNTSPQRAADLGAMGSGTRDGMALDSFDHDGRLALGRWLETGQCRRIILGEHFDGRASWCLADPSARMCDYCSEVESAVSSGTPAEGNMALMEGAFTQSSAAHLLASTVSKGRQMNTEEYFRAETAEREGERATQGGSTDKGTARSSSSSMQLDPVEAAAATYGSGASPVGRDQRLGQGRQMEESDVHDLLRMLEENRGCCGFCFARGKVRAEHVYSACSRKHRTGQTLSSAAHGQPGFKVHYEHSVKGACFFCHTPRAIDDQAHRQILPSERKGRQHCLFPDFLKPLAWALWEHADTRAALVEACEFHPEKVASFAQCVGRPVGSRWTVLGKICLWWYRAQGTFEFSTEGA